MCYTRKPAKWVARQNTQSKEDRIAKPVSVRYDPKPAHDERTLLSWLASHELAVSKDVESGPIVNANRRAFLARRIRVSGVPESWCMATGEAVRLLARDRDELESSGSRVDGARAM